MQAPRLVATDVDGTLLDPDDRVTPRAAAVIDRLVAAGVGFVLVTGPAAALDPAGARRAADRPAGGVRERRPCSTTPSTTACSGRGRSPPTPSSELAEATAEVLPGCGLAVERVGASADDSSVAQFVAEPAYVHAWPDPDHASVERSELLDRPAIKMLVRAPELSSDAMVAALTPVVGHLADLTFSHPRGLVEMSLPGVTKATGLAEVARDLGVDAADVVAFGDMPNDLEMLRWAGHGVAMGNAHPALLDVADEVTASHAEDGLAVVLERWF